MRENKTENGKAALDHPTQRALDAEAFLNGSLCPFRFARVSRIEGNSEAARSLLKEQEPNLQRVGVINRVISPLRGVIGEMGIFCQLRCGRSSNPPFLSF
jgi:hypothetical protein